MKTKDNVNKSKSRKGSKPFLRDHPQFRDMLELVHSGSSLGEVARAYGVTKSALFHAMRRDKELSLIKAQTSSPPKPNPEASPLPAALAQAEFIAKPAPQPTTDIVQARHIWRLAVKVDLNEVELYVEADDFAEAFERSIEVCAKRGLRQQGITSLSHMAVAYSRR